MWILFLISAILLMCIAHTIRLIRWQLFIKVYEKPNSKELLGLLSIGYLLNYIFPLKIGDIVRAWFSGKRMKNGKALGFSTIIVERYLDIISVGIVFIILAAANKNVLLQKNAKFYVMTAVGLLAVALSLYAFKTYVKKGISHFAKVFCSSIESKILRFVWALVWNFKDIFLKISRIKLIITTIGMWGGYVASYFLFAKSLSYVGNYNTTWVDMFTILFAQNGISLSTINTIIFGGNDVVTENILYMLIYMIAPIIILLVFSYLPVLKNVEKDYTEENYLNLLPHLDSKERLAFLEIYFSDKNREFVSNYLKINRNILIIRDFSAGSNATTMLCMDGEKTFFRKYAFGKDGEKLYQQVQWIEDNSARLTLPGIIKQDYTKAYCFYDMPYASHSVGLFEYVHSMPLDKGWRMIQGVLESLEASIYKVDIRKADKETINEYIESKVDKNLCKIKGAKRINSLQQFDTVYINGVEYKNLPFYEKFLNKKFLYKIFQNDTYSVIHGDLTIENIICTREDDGTDDFYIIDPNPGNVHDSPNLDYGKLLQSIHGGYEFLMSTTGISVNGNHIDFMFTKSSVYIELHKRLRDYMHNNLGEERTRSIYFHEIIHWLRLMPYKIEKDGKRALLFYAGMLMVMDDVIEMYGG